MARVAAGDQAAFGELYDATSAKLFATIRRISSSEAAAEDAMQEAYLRVWRRAGDFDCSIASPVAWMTTIARHAAIDAIRRTPERIAAAGAAIDGAMAESLADPLADIERLAPGSGLARCLGEMDSDRRDMVLLAYIEGCSREELAERFRRPVGTIKTLLRRSLIMLKECLGG
jgi:RNA polymerase sigma-70 factor (ECF subfamily)